MKPLASCHLFTFVDTAYLAGRSPETIAKQLCDGGSDLIQFRAKNWSTDEIQRTAEKLLAITEAADVGLVINDHWTTALSIGAPYCHLGQEDFFDSGFTHISQLGFYVRPPRSRALPRSHAPTLPRSHAPTLPRSHAPTLPRSTKLGLSTHAPDQAERAIAAGADYIAIGPVFATGTKPTATPVTLDYVRWAAKHVEIPWFAIGGITLDNLKQVLAAGARRICVVSAILRAPDVIRACQAFKKQLVDHHF